MAEADNEPALVESTAAEERQCYICLEESEPGVYESNWVSPCRCSGTMAWVHQVCLVRWIRELEHMKMTPTCTQCRTHFVLIPDKGVLFPILDMFYERIIPACKDTTAFLVLVVVIDSAAITMGLFALVQVYGVTKTLHMLMSYGNPFEAHMHLQIISYSLYLIRNLPWQECLLQAMRRSSRLPILREVLPADISVRFQEPPRKQAVWRKLGDVLMLPVFAKIVGTLFFRSVESPLSRVLIGGGVFLTLECGLYMYLSQKRLKRQQLIRVLSVQEVVETADTEVQ